MTTLPTAGSVTDFEWQRQAKAALDPIIAGKKNVKTVTAAYTARRGDDVIRGDATGAAFSITLPPANQYSGMQFIIKKIDASANAVTIDGNGAETIDGALTVALSTQYESRTLVSNGTGWDLI